LLLLLIELQSITSGVFFSFGGTFSPRFYVTICFSPWK